MDGSIVQTYLGDVLHAVAQALLAPDIILLLAFIAYALFCIGSIIAERFSERRHFNVVMPKFLAALMAAKEDEIPDVIIDSGLLHRQKVALLTVYDYRMLPGDALVALIRRLVSEEETRYDRITGRNNMAARVAPMLGLMGTLIPLGPGIQALGKADTAALSNSLLVAFDTTVAGLVAAAVCLVVAKIRANWYTNYMSALDSGMATMLQKIEDMRAEGKIVVQEPSDYAFLFDSSGPKRLSKEEREAAAAAQQENAKASEGRTPAASMGVKPDQLAQSQAAAGRSSNEMPLGAANAATGAQSDNRTVAKPAAQPYAGTVSGAGTTGPIFATPSSQRAGQAGSSTTMPTQSFHFGSPQSSGQSAGSTGPLFGSYPAPSASGSPSTFDSKAIPSIEPQRVAPAIQEVPMPAFIDALAASGTSGVEGGATRGSSTGGLSDAGLPDPMATSSAGAWYKQPAQGAPTASPSSPWKQANQPGQPGGAGNESHPGA